MRKLSEYKDEEALDLFAELIEPVAELTGDAEFMEAFRQKDSRWKAVKVAIKNHKPAVMALMAAVEGVPLEEYHCNVFSLPVALIRLLSDKDLLSVFTLQVQETSTPSGPVTENTGDGEV